MSQSPSTIEVPAQRRQEIHSLGFEAVFDQFQRPIYNYLLRLTQDQAEAEDLSQETFIRVYRNLSTFRGEASLSTWIYRIATNVSLDRFRRNATRHHEATLSLEEMESDGEWIADETSPSPEQLVTESEIAACVGSFVQRLPPDYRAALVLHDLQGLRNREIADVLGVSLSTVKIRLHRARSKLRAALNACCDFAQGEWDSFSCEPRTELREYGE